MGSHNHNPDLDPNPTIIFGGVKFAEQYREGKHIPPEGISKCVTTFLQEKPGPLNHCVDVGCGTGQNTIIFADAFEKVTGVDISEGQIEVAKRYNTIPNVDYLNSTAEILPFPDGSVDLVTVCAALSWFDLNKFYKQVDRILRSGGVLAVYTYHIYQHTKATYNGIDVHEPIAKFYKFLEGVSPIPGSCHIQDEYHSLPAAYDEGILVSHKTNPELTKVELMSVALLISYLDTAGYLPIYRQNEGYEKGQAVLDQCQNELLALMGTDDTSSLIKMEFKYFLRMWRKP